MNEEEFIKLLNAVLKIAKPFGDQLKQVTAMTDKFADLNVDSLDMLLTSIYMCDVFNISEELGKTMQPVTVQDMRDFLFEHHRQMPETADAALKEIV